MVDGRSDSAPERFHGVTLSSTFADLESHRAALARAVEGQGMHAIDMEQDAALPDGDVVEHSLRKVRAGAAYIGVVSRRYGQVPECEANPEGLSLTQLEFREARRLERPTLIFIMAEDHPVTEADVEFDPAHREKLAVFREEVKRAREGSPVHRIYHEFRDLAGFATAAAQSVAALRRLLDASDSEVEPQVPAPAEHDGIPAPPRLYAEPPYIGSHPFVGRVAQLETLDDWAIASDPHPVLLFEAIGGTGKSMLTWEWVRHHASNARGDWAGVFWYSFYEKGAVMADFCRRALAYMTQRPLDEFQKLKQPALSEQLLRRLRERPWLLVLDGLERVLVAYHRADAAQLADEDAGETDEIARRDPCAAIRPQDDDLLRDLSAAAPSKIVVSSRLLPRVLLNPAAQPIPGVLHERLPGLRPMDAEAMVRACGVEGDSTVIREFLQRHCDCHPLVTGVIAGLVLHYLPARGAFDVWAADPVHGGRLDLAGLDLIQKRNHILRDALSALSDSARQLLAMVALLPESADAETLEALNPHLEPEPEAVSEPADPRDSLWWSDLGEVERQDMFDVNEVEWAVYRQYREALERWRRSRPEADRLLAGIVDDLERRGLVQYDVSRRRYDLHPVVRAVAVPGRHDDRGPGELEQLGQRVVDHFSVRAARSSEDAEGLADLSHGMAVVRVLQRMGRADQALDVYRSDLCDALHTRLEAYVEALTLLRPFFGADWSTVSPDLEAATDRAWVAADAGVVLGALGEVDLALAAHVLSFTIDIDEATPANVLIGLSNIAGALDTLNGPARAERLLRLGLEASEIIDNDGRIFDARVRLYSMCGARGAVLEAERLWAQLDPMGRDWPLREYGPGYAECVRARVLHQNGEPADAALHHADDLVRSGRFRAGTRFLHWLRAERLAERGDWAGAVENYDEAVRMARENSLPDPEAETGAALARLLGGRLADPQAEVARLATFRRPDHLQLARMWRALDEPGRAVEHALAAYRRAWADGEPYVRRYALDRARELLVALGEPVPDLPAYDPVADPVPEWERLAEGFVERLRRKKAAGEF